MYLPKALLSLALLAPLASATPQDIDPTAVGILTADDSTPDTSFAVNPSVAETGVGSPVTANSPAGSSGADSGSGSGSGAGSTTVAGSGTATTTPIPTDILTAIDSDPSAAGSMSTAVATATATSANSDSDSDAPASTSSGEGDAASPTPTDDAATAVLGSHVSMLGAVLLSLLVPFF